MLDEFQWLKAAQPALDSIIQRHWDGWDRDGVPITLVLSGSALTLMERMLDQGAPLFGRAAARPRLQPLDYRRGGGVRGHARSGAAAAPLGGPRAARRSTSSGRARERSSR